MKFSLALLVLTLSFSIQSFSQTDTTYLYFDEGWKESSKEKAFYYGVAYKKDALWSRKDFWVKGNRLQMEATYLDKEFKNAHGPSKYYNENGTLRSITEYENGKSKSADYFYESGKKLGTITYTSKGSIHKGWDENGKEIPNYIVEKEAVFPGGVKAWTKYLEQNLDGEVAARSKAKVGIYTVKVQFIVDKEGNIANVKAIEVPAECKRCEKEAVRIIKNAPAWEPAVQYNKKVIYQAIQSVSFQVIEDEVK